MIKLNLTVQSLLGNDISPHLHSGEQNAFYQVWLFQTLQTFDWAGYAEKTQFISQMATQLLYVSKKSV